MCLSIHECHLNLIWIIRSIKKAPLMYLTKAQTWALADELGCVRLYSSAHSHLLRGVEGGLQGMRAVN